MTRHLLTLLGNDLAVSCKNKTVYLLLFIPVFVFFALHLVDHPNAQTPPLKIGLVRGQPYAAGVAPSLEAATSVVGVQWLGSEGEGRKMLTDKQLDGVLLVHADSSTLLVQTKSSTKTLMLLERIGKVQKAAEARGRPDWISSVESVEADQGIDHQTLPVWLLMMVLLIGFLVIPPQVADEKEKKLLLGILQAPVREADWIAAKVLMGMSLTLLSISLLHGMSRFGFGNITSYAVVMLAGSFCFSSMGVLLGFLCRTQASARALGVMFYLPHLLPSALGDYSSKLTAVATFVPSYQLFVPLKVILLTGAGVESFLWPVFSLLMVGTACSVSATVLLHRRSLM